MSEAFICDVVRTPVGRYGGALSPMRPDDLAAHVLRSLVERAPQLDPLDIDEVVLGCANQAGEDNRNVARMAALLAGLPQDVPGVTVNRLCASGAEAIAQAARAVKTGEAGLVIAGGVESMSRAPFVVGKAESAFGRTQTLEDTTIGWRFVNPAMKARYGTAAMPETAENVADRYGISREDQDRFAERSQTLAARAQESGYFAEEIAPVTVKSRKAETVVDRDEHPRPGTDFATLQKLRPIVRPDGTITAGNASGVNDGAAALIIASEAAAKKHGLTPIARILGGATAGVPPRIMGMGPAPASKKLFARLGLTQADFDVVELNEAFASQGIAVLRDLGIAEDDPRVNPNGGAIALGHPLGMSGARITGTAALELALSGKKRALATMCIGVGQGIAISLETV